MLVKFDKYFGEFVDIFIYRNYMYMMDFNVKLFIEEMNCDR